jgi:hypothetical protein
MGATMFDPDFCEKKCPIGTQARAGNRGARFCQAIDLTVTFGGCPWGRARQKKYGVAPNEPLPQQPAVTAAVRNADRPKSNKSAFASGYSAYWIGVDLEKNPYGQGKNSADFGSWIAGWCEAREHDYLR